MAWPVNRGAILRSVQQLFEGEQWWQYTGAVVRELERRFAAAHGCEFAVGVCNGTVGLDVVLRALGIGAGDRVILPAYNYYSLPKSVINVGATPVFVDVSEGNPTLDAGEVRKAITRGVKAVVAVHLCGCVAELDALRAVCDEAKVALIEDCAQAHGARYGGRRVGSWGDAGIFSFGGVKLMTAGQGGMIVTSNPQLHEKCHAMVHRGRSSTGQLNNLGIIGDNYELPQVSAAMLLPQLEILEALCAQREKVAEFLDWRLSAIAGLSSLRQFTKTTCRAQMRYSFLFDPQSCHCDRATFIREANMLSIPLEPGYAAVPNEARLMGRFTAGEFPQAQMAEQRMVSLFHWHLLRGAEYWDGAILRLRRILWPAEMGVESEGPTSAW
jgi:3-amino-5-hydroxybenzoate synthase